jgi:hypothetical protein
MNAKVKIILMQTLSDKKSSYHSQIDFLFLINFACCDIHKINNSNSDHTFAKLDDISLFQGKCRPIL